MITHTQNKYVKESPNKSVIHQAIRQDPVLSQLYEKDFVDVDSAVAAGVDNAAFKLAMLRLAWIMIRRLTKA